MVAVYAEEDDSRLRRMIGSDGPDDLARREYRTLKPSISEAVRAHILDGDRHGGGHRYPTTKANKTEFPMGWDDEQILAAIQSVLTHPRIVVAVSSWFVLYGETNRVRMMVRVERSSGAVLTAHPIDGDGVTRSKLINGVLEHQPVPYGVNRVVTW